MKAFLTLVPGLLALSLVACGDDDGGEVTDPIEAGADDTDDVPDTDDTDDTDDPAGPTSNPEAGIPNLHEVPDSGDPGQLMCAELGTYCHDYDNNDGELGEQCHDVGHTGDPEACAEIYDECMAFCQEPVEAGTHDGGDGHGHGDAMCEELGSVCHDFDHGSGLAQECHETGHAGEPGACAAIYDQCIAHCVGDAGGHHEPGDGGHHGADAGEHHADAGSALCEELGHMCHDYDDGDGLGHECHEIGHAGEHAACEAIFDDCAALCHGDAGHSATDASASP